MRKFSSRPKGLGDISFYIPFALSFIGIALVRLAFHAPGVAPESWLHRGKELAGVAIIYVIAMLIMGYWKEREGIKARLIRVSTGYREK